VEFEDDAYILAARSFGETGAIVEMLTKRHGKYAAHVAGAASRKMKPFLQAGARVTAQFRARTSDQLGSAVLEPVGEGPSALFDDRMALAGLSAAAAVAAGALPEREPHPGAFLGFEAFIAALAAPEIWPAVYVRFEAGLLADLGFGLDLSRCAVTGSPDDLIYVSPRTGRAVSAGAGAPYKDRLFALPPFLLSSQGGLGAGDVTAGLTITGHFLERFVFAPLNRPLPPARHWLLDRLSEAARL
jgi:DNA repair protein RecO (recombination protein O)